MFSHKTRVAVRVKELLKFVSEKERKTIFSDMDLNHDVVALHNKLKIREFVFTVTSEKSKLFKVKV